MNMKKITLSLFALAILMSACVKTPEPTRFSILGDSFSSLEGYVDPDTNDHYLNYAEIGVTGPELMWWSQVADSMGWVMDKNNSFSGSLVCNFSDFEGGSYYASQSFIQRMDQLGNPDVIFVFGATNDIYQNAALGEYVYTDWNEEQLCDFRPALAYLFDYLKHQHPRATLYFLLDLDLCGDDPTIDDTTRLEYIKSVHRIASHYGVSCIDISDIHKDHWHPNAEGQRDIANQVLEALALDFNV